MPAEIVKCDWEELLRIETPVWRAELVLSVGANLWRLEHRPSGLEILYRPDTLAEFRQNPELYGLPVLFPPNRIADGRFMWAGREYRLPLNEPLRKNHLHGLLSRRRWQLADYREEGDSVQVTASFQHTPETEGFGCLPHEFRFDLTYRFEPEAVTQVAAVENLSAAPLPLAVGFHTAFRLPFRVATPEARQACRVYLSTGIEYWDKDLERHLPSGQRRPFPPDQAWATGVAPAGRAISLLCPIETIERYGRPWRGAILESPVENTRLIYEVDAAFKQWVLFNQAGEKDCFYPEPQTCLVNAFNLDLPAEVTGAQALAPGQTWNATSRISLQTCR